MKARFPGVDHPAPGSIAGGAGERGTFVFSGDDNGEGLAIDLASGLAYDPHPDHPWIDLDALDDIEVVIGEDHHDIIAIDTLDAPSAPPLADDFLQYAGSHDRYEIDLERGSVSVFDLLGEDGIDIIYGAEAIRFDDGVLGRDEGGNWVFVGDLASDPAALRGGIPDLFVVHDGSNDVITDFNLGDALVFEGFSAADIHVEETDAGLVIGAGRGEMFANITLENPPPGSGYATSIAENEDGNAVVTLGPPTEV